MQAMCGLFEDRLFIIAFWYAVSQPERRVSHIRERLHRHYPGAGEPAEDSFSYDDNGARWTAFSSYSEQKMVMRAYRKMPEAL